MKPHCFVVPAALLLLAWSGSASRVDAAEETSAVPKPPAKAAQARADASELDAVRLPGMDFPPAKGTTNQDEMRARMAELRERVAAGDPGVAEEVRALVADLAARADAGDPAVTVTRDATGAETVSVTSSDRGFHGATTSEERRARLEELRARAAAGDPNVRITSSSTVTSSTMGVEEARAKIAEMRARAAAGDPNVTITSRSTVSPPTVKLTEAERARREAYVASHPDLPARTKATILAGLFVPAMKLEDVEQLVGPLKPVEGRLPNGELPYPDEKVYTVQHNGQTVYLYFRDGKLLRR